MRKNIDVWLREQPDEVLQLAISWPIAMTKVMHAMGIVFTICLVSSIYYSMPIWMGFFGAATGWALYKIYKYRRDIALISNEQRRRANIKSQS